MLDLKMHKLNHLAALVVLISLTSVTNASAGPQNAEASQDAQRRAEIRQHMQQRSFEQRLDNQAGSRRTEDTVDRAIREQRRARERAIGR